MPPTAAEVRQQFLDFFAQRHQHTVVDSSAVVPHDDPTLLFTNAGMNQFKDVFLGRGNRDYTRAVDTQKCIRAGGKHNDLEDVGRDTYHHTFFEMLGNWSFGDYFKAEAIEWAWELLTEVWGLPPERLYVSVFAGDKADGLPADEEAAELWRRFVPENRISRFDKKDNFWEMGATGPCGPCSEIHFDGTPDGSGGHLVNADDPQVIEIWNLVFMQFNRGDDGTLVPLPAKHVDTGMGFERIVRVLQGKDSNYDTDVFTGIFEAIRTRTGARPYGADLKDPLDTAYRILADHLRCLSVALADGARPGADGRNYVLRRILRRAVRHVSQTFGVQEPCLFEMVPAVTQSLGPIFPELIQEEGKVQAAIHDEEVAFHRTLGRGTELFAQAAAEAGSSKVIDGATAFRLHDTFGFPVDLTQVMAEEAGLQVDLQAYESEMEAARERSRSGGGAGDDADLPPERLAALAERVAATDDSGRDSHEGCSATVGALLVSGNLVEEAQSGDEVSVVLDRTNFYAEMGGQVGDTGTLEADGICVRIHGTKRCGDFVLHMGAVESGTLRPGQSLQTCLDVERRSGIEAHHTATHLLNLGLRTVVGEESDQRGSLVEPDRLRFDYATSAAPSSEDLQQVESLVREAIREDLSVAAGPASLEAAKSIRGLRAVFGERYPDPVRVVSIGPAISELLADPSNDWSNRSVEFCGGTHVDRTSEVDDFALLGEGSLSAGVRRVTGVVGAAAKQAHHTAKMLSNEIDEVAKTSDDQFAEAFALLLKTVDSATVPLSSRARIDTQLVPLRERAKKLRKAAAAGSRDLAIDFARQLVPESSGIVIARVDMAADRDALLAALDTVRGSQPEAPVLLLSADLEEKKVSIVARVPEAGIARGLKAGDWARCAAEACGGKGGGRPDMAQAGGKDPTLADAALEAARHFANERLA